MKRVLWWLACPHHFYELHVKKVARFYFGETTCPEETIYKRLKDDWNKIIEQEIDYDDLELFDWQRGGGAPFWLRELVKLLFTCSLS